MSDAIPAILPPFSPSIANVAAALAAAQGEFEAAEKDRQATVKSDKGSYSYKYANFASLMSAVRGPLAKYKLALTVRARTDAKGATATAILLHASGEWLCGDPITITANASTPQATGSALEYARKYAVRTLLNIATDDESDDDGQAAAGHGAVRAPAQASAKRAAAPTQSGAIKAAGGITSSEMDRAGPPPVDAYAEALATIAAAKNADDLARTVDVITSLGVGSDPKIRAAYGERQKALKKGAA